MDFIINLFGKWFNKTHDYSGVIVLGCGENTQYICEICLEKIEKSDTITVCKCSTVFHQKCLNTWLISNEYMGSNCPDCPVCNEKV